MGFDYHRLILAAEIFLWSITSLSVAQSIDPLRLFPHHLDDYWEYEHYDPSCNPFGYSTKTVTLDSLLPDGNYLVEVGGWIYYVDTTAKKVFLPGPKDTTLYYKLDAKLGEKWYTSNSEWYWAVVTDIFTTPILNEVKVIEFWGKSEVDSLWMYTDYLQSDFGLIRQDVEGGCPFGDMILSCCIINGIQYGVCVLGMDNAFQTSVIDGFRLFQNYPNPFNQSTVIRYNLPRAVLVNLAIYDLTGRKIRKLVQTVQPAGEYEINWNGTDDSGKMVSSGVYVAQLSAGIYKKSIKLELIK